MNSNIMLYEGHQYYRQHLILSLVRTRRMKLGQRPVEIMKLTTIASIWDQRPIYSPLFLFHRNLPPTATCQRNSFG